MAKKRFNSLGYSSKYWNSLNWDAYGLKLSLSVILNSFKSTSSPAAFISLGDNNLPCPSSNGTYTDTGHVTGVFHLRIQTHTFCLPQQGTYNRVPKTTFCRAGIQIFVGMCLSFLNHTVYRIMAKAKSLASRSIFSMMVHPALGCLKGQRGRILRF